MKIKQIKSVVASVVLLALCAVGCAADSGKSPEAAPAVMLSRVNVAGQFGLVYAPFLVALEQGIFQKYGLDVQWQELGSGGAIREGMTAGEIDVGSMGIAAYIVGWDKGLPAKIAGGFGSAPSALVTWRPEITSLRDLRPEHRIALPCPGSVQHILLAMAAEKELGNPKALDNQLIALPMPDAELAMAAKNDIDAHFCNPPYLFRELSQPGCHAVVSGPEALGTEYSINVIIVTEKFHDERPADYAAFMMGLNEAVAWINENRAAAVTLLAGKFRVTAAEMQEYLEWEEMDYNTMPRGLMAFGDFMQQAGYIARVPEQLSDIAWENVLAIVGKRGGTPSELERIQYRPEQ